MDPTPSGLSSDGETTAIVRELKRYGVSKSIPVRFLARSVGRRTDEILDTLQYLRAQDIVSLGETDDPENATVRLLKN